MNNETLNKIELPEFVPFPKIPRLSRDVVITEKLDGTNAQVYITDYGDIYAGSRNKWVFPSEDNYGFAKWVLGNEEELLKLGPGDHYGEWWGQGIQRGYNLKEKRFSLFNTGKWNPFNTPECCHTVPVIYAGPFNTITIDDIINDMESKGSYACDFDNPEGIMIYHTAAHRYFKKTIKNDEKPKGSKE